MTKMTKRTALGMLGLGAVAAPIETFAKPLDVSGLSFGGASKEDIAAALRRLADDVEAGGTYPQEVALITTVRLDSFTLHRFVIEFAMNENLHF